MGKIIGEGITFDDVLLVPDIQRLFLMMVDLRTSLLRRSNLTFHL